ncbi:hypothetical protein GYA93_05455 [Gordonia desulfuricans]|uniref:Uncharacterized protein n=1 Tax=Gordonia desulfuricans TaxID=89051 RepID=A0A7K3LL99_9ACTN|nr:hypothetical protein [Gordonia desulfuricans]NDK89029.1 hypothetical protein [Gordonia desulfuricans]
MAADHPGRPESESRPESLEAAADELYGLAPGDFVARRNILATLVRRGGDRALATQIGALRRPTVSAWLLNQWVRRHPDGVTDLTELGGRLREAQRRGAAGQVRDLSARRREVVTAAVIAVGHLADDLGVPVSAGTEREIVQTLRAAMADADIADGLARGRLTAAGEYSGFGPAAVFAVPDPAADAHPPTTASSGDAAAADPGRDAQARRAAAEAGLARARADETRARRGTDRAALASAEATHSVEVITDQLDRLRADVARLEQELGFARRRQEGAEAAERAAHESLENARQAVAAAQERLDGEDPGVSR